MQAADPIAVAHGVNRLDQMLLEGRAGLGAVPVELDEPLWKRFIAQSASW